jgi:murein DD-endopeptidase
MKALPSDLWVDLIGLPFRYHGRGPKTYDCFGIVKEINRRLGIEVFDRKYTPDDLSITKTVDADLATNRWNKSEIGAGATLLFRRGLAAVHVGVAIDLDRFIHASDDHGSVLVSRLDTGTQPYRSFLLGAYRYAI